MMRSPRLTFPFLFSRPQTQTQDLAVEAMSQADKAARTMSDAMGVEGFIPAVLKGGASDAQTISAIEGLVYPLVAECRDALDPDGRFGVRCRPPLLALV